MTVWGNGVPARIERSRMGDLLVEMGLLDEQTLLDAMAEQRSSGRRLPRILGEKRVLDEERLTKAVAAKLGLEVVNVASLKIHERVLALIPPQVALRYGVLPIAIKRANGAEYLYLVMADPLDAEAIGEVQRVSGRQVRVLMASASDVDQAIDAQYRALQGRQVAPPGPPTSPPPPVAPSGIRAAPQQAARPVPVRAAAAPPKSTPPPQRVAAARPSPPQPRPAPPGPESDLVHPSEMEDPRGELHTRIDGPTDFRAVQQDEPRPSAQADWDLAVRDWDQAQASNDLGKPAGVQEVRADSDPVTTEAQLDHFDDDEPFELVEVEEIKTGEIELEELSEVQIEALQPAPVRNLVPEPAHSQVPEDGIPAFAAAFEIPIDVDDSHHPFDGPGLEEIPTGLERTGIIPAIDWEVEEFEPPPLPARDVTNLALVDGDIPLSDEATHARAGEVQAPGDMDDGATVEGPTLDFLAALELPPELAPPPQQQQPEDSDADAMPVIEPSSLVSLMDEQQEIEDTGADAIPELEPPAPKAAPPTRLFDESNREVVSGPQGSKEEEPTNPRIDTSSVQAMLDVEESAAETDDVDDGDAVLSALDGQFNLDSPEPVVEQAAPKAQPPIEREEAPASSGARPDERSRSLVRVLMQGRSLKSAERAELVLALGRLLIKNGVLDEEELAMELSLDADER